MADRKQRVQKIMTQPINVIYGHLKNKARVQIWLYDQADLKIEGVILGFDEFMNLVLDEAAEVHKKKGEKYVGRVLLKGDNISLIMNSGR